MQLEKVSKTDDFLYLFDFSCIQQPNVLDVHHVHVESDPTTYLWSTKRTGFVEFLPNKQHGKGRRGYEFARTTILLLGEEGNSKCTNDVLHEEGKRERNKALLVCRDQEKYIKEEEIQGKIWKTTGLHVKEK